VVMRNMTVTNLGEVTFPPPAISVSAAPPKPAASVADKPKQEEAPSKLKWILGALGIAGFAAVASVAPAEFLSHFTVFILSCVVGYYVVWNVSHSLHTPLMSVTNAISGIIVVGALLQIGQGSTLVTVLAFIAVLIASINIFGGFTVTQRMLKMFRKD
jgi:NAD(P) transhydrogenase subunit alpha